MDAQLVAFESFSMHNVPTAPAAGSSPATRTNFFRNRSNSFFMKTTLLLAGAVLLLATGCSRRYNVTLNNGATITALTKPKLTPGGSYVFKDASGKITEVNSMRVKLIEPTTLAKEHTTKYNQPFQFR